MTNTLPTPPLLPATQRLIERLHAAAEALKDESVALERRLAAGELALDGFVEQYIAIRTRHHSLDLKYHAAVQTIPTTTAVGPSAAPPFA